MLGRDVAVFVDDESGWNRRNASKILRDFFVTHNNRIVHPELLHERLNHGRALLVERDANDDKPFVAVFLLQLDETRNLGLAGWAPCCPEVQYDNLPGEVRRFDQLSLSVLQLPFGRLL